MSDSDSVLKRGLETSRFRKVATAAVSGSRFLDWASVPGERLSSRIHTATAPIRAGLSRIVTHSFIYRWMTKEPDPEVIVIDLRDSFIVSPVVRVLESTISVGTSALRNSLSSRVVRRVKKEPFRFAGIVVTISGLIQAAVTVTAGNSAPAVLILWGAVTMAGLVGIADTRSWSELGGSKTGELLMMMFEPPDPPETADSAKTDTPAEQPKQRDNGEASDSEADYDQKSE